MINRKRKDKNVISAYNQHPFLRMQLVILHLEGVSDIILHWMLKGHYSMKCDVNSWKNVRPKVPCRVQNKVQIMIGRTYTHMTGFIRHTTTYA